MCSIFSILAPSRVAFKSAARLWNNTNLLIRSPEPSASHLLDPKQGMGRGNAQVPQHQLPHVSWTTAETWVNAVNSQFRRLPSKSSSLCVDGVLGTHRGDNLATIPQELPVHHVAVMTVRKPLSTEIAAYMMPGIDIGHVVYKGRCGLPTHFALE